MDVPVSYASEVSGHNYVKLYTLAGDIKTKVAFNMDAPGFTVTCNPNEVLAGDSVSATITREFAPLAGGVNFTFPANPHYVFPPSVHLDAGKKTATFTIGTVPSSGPDWHNYFDVTSMGVGLVVTNLLTKGNDIASVAWSQPSIVGTQTADLTISLVNPASAGGKVVTLHETASSFNLPLTVTIPAGQTSAVLHVTTLAVSSLETATITANVSGQTPKSATLKVNPPSLVSAAISPTQIVGGDSCKPKPDSRCRRFGRYCEPHLQRPINHRPQHYNDRRERDDKDDHVNDDCRRRRQIRHGNR